MIQTIELKVNGSRHEVRVDPSRNLLDVLREELGLTGAKRSCDDGSCGSCIVSMGNKGVMSCLLPVKKAQEKEIITIEGLSKDGKQLHPLQQTFIDTGATQCGYCIPGIIMQATTLLKNNNNPTKEEVVKHLARNICRCGGYTQIVKAVLDAGKLMRGEKIVAQPTGFPLIGRRISRIDGVKYVTGVTKYGVDLKMAGMLHAKVLRSPHHHANIVSVDISAAEKVPGVLAVVTAKDIPGRRFMLNGRPQTFFFPEDKVRFMGEGLAAVAAETPEAAATARDLIKVKYEVLSATLDPLEALAEGASKVSPPLSNADPEFAHEEHGQVDAAFSQSDAVVEGVYAAPRREHLYLEPEAALAYWGTDGRMTVRVALHHSFRGHEWIAQMLALPYDKVRIIAPAMGGGFGGRGDFYAAGVAALLAAKTGKPVKIVYTREESLLGSCKSIGYYMKYRTGASRDGKLTALDAEIVAGNGSWAPFLAPSTGGKEMIMYWRLPTSEVHHATGPYRIPNVRARARDVVFNGPRGTPMRGTVGPTISLAFEGQMDQLAEKLGLDPLEFRIKNCLQVGDKTHYGQVLRESVGQKAVLEALRPYYKEAKVWQDTSSASPWRKGIGVASGWRANIRRSPMDARASVELLEDGRIRIYAGAVEKGQGVTTTLTFIACEELKLRPDNTEVVLGDTILAPYPIETNASKVTVMVGSAVLDAAKKLKAALLHVGAEMLEAPENSLTVQDGFIYRQDEERKLSLEQIAAALKKHRMPLRYEGIFLWDSPKKDTSGATAYDPGAFPDVVFCYNAHLAQVEVNTTTGKVQVIKAVNASDPGTVINRKGFEGQITGCVVWGTSFALKEEFHPDKTRSMKAYGPLTIREAPEEIDIVSVEDPWEIGPYGAKGVGDSFLSAVGPATINAISNAIGVRLYEMPARPERVLSAWKNRQSPQRPWPANAIHD